MNAAHASLDFDSHTQYLIIVHRRIEDMVHAQMRLANASYGKILKTFNVAQCNAMLCLWQPHARIGQFKLSCHDLSLPILLLFCSYIEWV